MSTWSRHRLYCKFPGSARLGTTMPSSSARSSSTMPRLATRMAMVFTGVDIIIFLGVAYRRGAVHPHLAAVRPPQSAQRLDELGGNQMVGPRILTRDELAIDNHVGVEIDSPGGHLAACSFERIRHVEIQLCVKDLGFDPFLFRCRKNRHLVAGIWPSLGPFFGLVLITRDERCAKLSRVWHCRDERNRTVAEQCRGLRELMEVTEDLARVRVLHQVYDRRLATGHEHACVAVQPFLNHRTQRVDLVHRRIIAPEGLGARISGLVATKMHYRIRNFIDMRLSSVRGCEHEVITSLDQGHRRNDGFVEIIASRTGAAALHLNASGIGTEHKDFALGHLNFSFL